MSLSLPFGNRTRFGSSVVESISKIVMSDELAIPPKYTLCVVCLRVLSAENYHKSPIKICFAIVFSCYNFKCVIVIVFFVRN